ncbi:hypothetical protein HDG34_003217 [Paraburkholderia sp. HC6.4b]|uniref:hypothetical protein n=1 Tax=unclassified Paraburkholderia TaxID=2615204 RepID=UPI00160EA9A7|nr:MULTISPECIES: hypothetical protein [unclassified Paraburkholderia]MBB5409276.1 hypothetical protein [Paraburkholderia sp. HC6.4b]MBB5451004.1 hypothetical protein [Paraburkholderia sp. Kb1A]
MTTLLKNQRKVVALEAFALQDIAGLLRRAFPAIRKGFEDLAGLISPDDRPVVLSADQKTFLGLLAGHNYVTLSPLPARVPQGLKVPYLVYAEALSDAVSHAAQINEELSRYTLFLGRLVTSHEFQYSAEYDPAYYRELQRQREDDNQKLGQCYQTGSTRTERTYADVVSRNADWKTVFEVANRLTADINRVDRSIITKKIAESVHLLDVIEKKIVREELEGVSPGIVTELSEGAFQMASQLEMYSAVWYKVQTFVTAVDFSAEVVLRAFVGKEQASR